MDNVDNLPEEIRKVEVKRDGSWTSVRMSELRIGELFRLFNPGGDPVVWNDCQEFIAGSHPYIDERTGRWGVDSYRVTETDEYCREMISNEC